jgi:hypothetical protein
MKPPAQTLKVFETFRVLIVEGNFIMEVLVIFVNSNAAASDLY